MVVCDIRRHTQSDHHRLTIALGLTLGLVPDAQQLHMAYPPPQEHLEEYNITLAPLNDKKPTQVYKIHNFRDGYTGSRQGQWQEIHAGESLGGGRHTVLFEVAVNPFLQCT